jgi:hypothetical protein
LVRHGAIVDWSEALSPNVQSSNSKIQNRKSSAERGGGAQPTFVEPMLAKLVRDCAIANALQPNEQNHQVDHEQQHDRPFRWLSNYPRTSFIKCQITVRLCRYIF